VGVKIKPWVLGGGGVLLVLASSRLGSGPANGVTFWVGIVLVFLGIRSARSRRRQQPRDPLANGPGSLPMPSNEMLDLMSGDSFLRSMSNGEIPPPGSTFINRFLNGDPTSWADEFEDVRESMSDEADLRISIRRLGEELDKVHTEGAAIPELQALEEAVTLNLSGLTILLASQVLTDHPELKLHLQPIDFCWTLQDEVSHLAMTIRQRSSALDVGIHISGGDLETQPGECFRCCVELLETGANAIRSGGEQAIREINDAGSIPMIRMLHAREVIDRREN
jgi:hypothetical protein